MTPLVDTPTGLQDGTFGIAALAGERGPVPVLVTSDGGVIDVSDLYGSTREMFEHWADAFPALQVAADRAPDARFGDADPLPPVDRPNLMLSGSNYVTHVAQMLTRNRFNQHERLPGESDDEFFRRNTVKAAARRESGTPFLFVGLHSALVGANHEIVLPELGDQPDWELELGVVVGPVRRYSTLSEAQEAIAGYVIIDDLGTVDVFRRTDVHFGFDWISKFQPTFKPIGPFVVPAPFVDVAEMTIRLSVDGQVMQDWPADDFIFGPAECVAYLSERIDLRPGDVIAMGSPPGNGAHHGRFLRDGDVIDAEITGLGRQRNRCRQEDLQGRTPVYGHWTNTPERSA